MNENSLIWDDFNLQRPFVSNYIEHTIDIFLFSYHLIF